MESGAGDRNEAGAGGAGGRHEAGAGGSDQDGGADVPLFGAVAVVSTTVESCTSASWPMPVLVLPGGSANPIHDRLGSVGERQFAFSRDAQTLLTFDAAGALSTALNQVGAVASNGAELSVVFQDATRAVLQRYDANLVPHGESIPLADSALSSLAAAATATATLVSWIDGGQLVIRVSAGEALAELSIPVGENLDHCRAQAAAADSGFALLWSCRGSPNEVRWAFVSEAAEFLESSVLLRPAIDLDLVAFMPAPTGYVSLLHSLEQKTAYLFEIGTDGQVDGAVRAISGLSQAFDLATSASTTSVAGQLENGISALGRVLENTRPGAAGVWTCLDETSPGGHAAVTATKQGDALLVRRANGSEWLMTLTY